jgi:hypothetical protein
MNLKTLQNEEQCVLSEWRRTLQRLLKLQDELWRVKDRIKEVKV